jgi:hypothetical protein
MGIKKEYLNLNVKWAAHERVKQADIADLFHRLSMSCISVSCKAAQINENCPFF